MPRGVAAAPTNSIDCSVKVELEKQTEDCRNVAKNRKASVESTGPECPVEPLYSTDLRLIRIALSPGGSERVIMLFAGRWTLTLHAGRLLTYNLLDRETLVAIVLLLLIT
jgi:hypothetical protein